MKLSRLLFVSLIAPAGIASAAHAQALQPFSALGASTMLNNVGATNTGGKVGTVQFSSSTGSSNNFSVGTSTGLGVNASASSTADYQVNSQAKLNVDGSLLKQTIGTSGIVDNTTQLGAAANTYAVSKANETYGSDYAAYTAMSVDQKAKVSSATLSQSEYDAQKSSAVQSYTTSYNNSKTYSDAKNGVISGSFTQAADAGVITQTKEITSIDSSGATLTGANSKTSANYAGDRIVETTSQTKGSTASNQVTVAGIGNAANIQSTPGSTFASTVGTRTTGASTGLSNSATANGSAGASLNSSATANSSATNFTSTFLQSF